MMTRELFDQPPAPRPRAQRIQRPALPVPARTPPEVWTLKLTSMPCDIPAAVRIRKFLKTARRAYSLRAVSVAGPTPDGTLGNSTPCISSEAPAAREIGSNAACEGNKP